MKRPLPLPPSLPRRHWLAAAASSLLSACGGGLGVAGLPGTGGTGTLAVLPGTGGTGIFVTGPITGLGTIWVNGVRYDDSQAQITLDGQPASPSDLRVGMVVSLQGALDSASQLGTAAVVDTWAIARGPVAAVGADRFHVNGMTLRVDAATTWDGVAGLTALTVGQRVAVWGLQSTSEGADWTATRVTRLQGSDTQIVTTGRVSNGTAVSLNGVSLINSPLGYSQGQLVCVTGTPTGSGQGLEVSHVRTLEAYRPPETPAESPLQASLSGLVSALVGPWRFQVGTVVVDATALSATLGGTRLSVGQRVEVKGVWDGPLLKASWVELQGLDKAKEVSIEARVEQFTSVADFVLRGQRCDASQARWSHGSPAQLTLGVKLKVKGNKQGDVLWVTEAEFED